MKGLGDGRLLWHVDVVLWVPERVTTNGSQERLLGALAARIHELPVDEVGWGRPPLTPASSYDIPPPAPDASVGVSCWVMADTVGAAADVALRAVESVADELLPGTSLWDLRIIPRTAILDGGPR